MSDPWAFGWTQLLTMVGMAITVSIALGGFRTFNRWKREKIEEKKIEFAFDGLAVAYETNWVFGYIRAPMTFGTEYKDMSRRPDETDDDWQRRGTYYAISKRIESQREFFDRVWKLQPRFMAAFGSESEEAFNLLHQSRRDIEVSAGVLGENEKLYRDSDRKDLNELWEQMRRDLWSTGTFQPEKDVVSRRLEKFRLEMEKLCKPVIDREFARRLKSELEMGETRARILELRGRLARLS